MYIRVFPAKKSPEKTGKYGGGEGRGVVSDRAYNIWPFFTLQVREKECLALQTTYKTRLRILEEVCRTKDNTSILVLKMLAVCVEARV